MEQSTHNVEELARDKAKKYNLWIGMMGMFMMFAALSSGFIVYTQGGVDKGIKTLLPDAFIYSTIIIVVSSITMHLALKAAKNVNRKQQMILLLITMVLGLVFFFIQMESWKILTNRGIYFINTNASQSFIYIFTGLHLAHIVAGILVLLRAFIGCIKNIQQKSNILRMEIASIFWHFLDFLWIYIYVFLLLNQ